MSDQTYSVRHQRTAHSGFVRLDIYEATITKGARTVTMVREVHDHGNGAVVLPYDETRRTCLLVRQLRLPVHVVEGDGLMLEAAAGVMDPDDASPAATAQREAAEELQYAVTDVEHVGTVYPIPGIVTEQMHCHIARYTEGSRISEGFEPDDDEIIDVEEWQLADLWRAWEDGELRDAKTVICLMALRLRRPELFDPVGDGLTVS